MASTSANTEASNQTSPDGRLPSDPSDLLTFSHWDPAQCERAINSLKEMVEQRIQPSQHEYYFDTKALATDVSAATQGKDLFELEGEEYSKHDLFGGILASISPMKGYQSRRRADHDACVTRLEGTRASIMDSLSKGQLPSLYTTKDDFYRVMSDYASMLDSLDLSAERKTLVKTLSGERNKVLAYLEETGAPLTVDQKQVTLMLLCLLRPHPYMAYTMVWQFLR